MTVRKLTRKDLAEAAEKYKNWGRWGPEDDIGTLNHTSPEDIVAAARLVRKGKVISLALNFDQLGPQGAKSKYPSLGRVNPVHTMLRSGTDAYSGVLDHRSRSPRPCQSSALASYARSRSRAQRAIGYCSRCLRLPSSVTPRSRSTPGSGSSHPPAPRPKSSRN